MTEYVCDPETILAAQEGDSAAMEQVVSTNFGLVKSIALRFAGRGVEPEDLFQIGCIGMIKAIHGFQAEKECKFTTYAVPLIIGELKRFFRDDGWIKISRDTRANGAKIFRFTEEYEKKEGKSPTMEIICAALDLPEDKVVLAMEAARPALSLYAEDENTGISPEKIVGEDNIEKITDRLAIREAVAALPGGEGKLISLRYFHNLTQEQTARILGMTQVKVSREEKRILKKMRSYLAS